MWAGEVLPQEGGISPCRICEAQILSAHEIQALAEVQEKRINLKLHFSFSFTAKEARLKGCSGVLKKKKAKITEFETHTEVNAKDDLTSWQIKVSS